LKDNVISLITPTAKQPARRLLESSEEAGASLEEEGKWVEVDPLPIKEIDQGPDVTEPSVTSSKGDEAAPQVNPGLKQELQELSVLRQTGAITATGETQLKQKFLESYFKTKGEVLVKGVTRTHSDPRYGGSSTPRPPQKRQHGHTIPPTPAPIQFANPPPGSAILLQGYDTFAPCRGEVTIGNRNCMKSGMIFRFLKDPQRGQVKLKEGSSVDPPLGWHISPGLQCSAQEDYTAVESSTYRHLVYSSISSQLNQQKVMSILNLALNPNSNPESKPNRRQWSRTRTAKPSRRPHGRLTLPNS